MVGLRDHIRGEPVHERRLELKTYPAPEDQVMVEGWLRDERLISGYHWDGRPREPGVVHWMCVRLLVGGWPLRVLAAEAEMPKSPHDQCPSTCESVTELVGLSIVSGFSQEVRKRIGGIRGCSHLVQLVMSMGPAALHGYWTHKSRSPRPLPSSTEDFPGLSLLKNSCRLWKEDGPLMEGIRNMLADREDPR